MRIKITLNADLHELCLTHVAAADGCVSAEIGNFLFFSKHTSAAHTPMSNTAHVNQPLLLNQL